MDDSPTCEHGASDGILRREDIGPRLSRPMRSGTSGAFAFTRLDLGGLCLSNIDILLDYKHLEIIDLKNNELTSESLLPLYFLPNLVEVNLSDNRIEAFGLAPIRTPRTAISKQGAEDPSDGVDSTRPRKSSQEDREREQLHLVQKPILSLKYLDLSYNRIREEPNMEFFPFIRKLNLSNNSLGEVQHTINDLIYLRSLDISHNFITVVPKAPELTHLNLSFNSIEVLTIQPSITHLYANDNNLSKINKASPDSALVVLDVSNNTLYGATATASALRCCRCLRDVTFKGLKMIKDELPDLLEDELESIMIAQSNTYEPPPIACQSLPTTEQLDRMRDKAKSLQKRDNDVTRCAIITELPQVKTIDGRDVSIDDVIESINWCRPNTILGLTTTSIFH